MTTKYEDNIGRQKRGLFIAGETARADVSSAIDRIDSQLVSDRAHTTNVADGRGGWVASSTHGTMTDRVRRLEDARDRLCLVYDELRVLFPIDQP